MPAVAEVQFKAAGSQQVVSAFNSVGSAAQSSSTKVQQNSTAMSSLGKGMKSSVSSIGQVTTAFATLSLSIVSTWRAYRDLGDAQIAVDKANLRVKKTQEAIKKTTTEIAALQKAGNKGGLEAERRRIDLTKLTIALTAAEKKYGKNSIQAADAALKLKEAQAAGTGSSEKLKAAQAKLGIQQEQLGVQQDVASEAQERFNDTQQNFYLSIIPTALSSIGLLTTAFKGLGGVFTGGGGLGGFIKFFGPIGLAIAGLYFAFKTNFLGIKDVIGGVIDWVKERFGLWKQAIEDVFSFIKAGDWGMAFERIKKAAAAFWADLKKSVPFFGEVEKLVEKIRGGNWKGAFLQIWKAATDAWATIKKNIPMFGEVEKWVNTMVSAIKNGDWATAAQGILNAFNATLGKGLEFIFGKNWKSGLDAWLKLQESEATINKRSLIVQYAITINATIKAITGIDIMKWFTDHPLVLTAIPITLTGITLSITDPDFQAALKKGAEVILGALGTALSAAAKVLDPYLAQVVAALNWNTAITLVQDALKNAGEAIWIWIFNGIKGGFQTQDWGKLFADFPAAVNDAWAKNLPQVQQAWIKNWQSSPMAKGLEALGIKFNFTVTPKLDPESHQIITKGVESGGPYKAPLDLNTEPAKKTDKTFKNQIERQKYIAQLGLNQQKAVQGLNQFVNKANNTHATVKLSVAWGPSNVNTATRQLQSVWSGKQHGYQSTVHRPTMFMAGEGGRPEDVTVRPRGSVQRGGGGGGGFNGTINVYVDGVLRPARYDMGARK